MLHQLKGAKANQHVTHPSISCQRRDGLRGIEPQVIKIAETNLCFEGVQRMADFYGAQDWLKRSRELQPNDTEFLIELAGRSCYRSFGVGLNPNVTRIRDNPKDYLTNVLEKGDGSILEHATVTFAFLNVSRVFCYSEDTEVLTNEGWKRFSEVNGSEEFATLNPSSFSIEYHPASDYVAERYSGKMVRIRSSMVDLLVTPNHRVFFYDYDKRSASSRMWKFSRADSLIGRRVVLKTDGIWKAPDIKNMIIPSITVSAARSDTGTTYERTYDSLQIPFDAYATFLGFYDAEGSLQHSEGASYHITICQSKKSPHVHEILDTVRAMGFVPSVFSVSENDCVVRIHSYQLYEHLKRFGRTSHNKRVPTEIKGASCRQIRLYLDAYTKGDGNVHKSGHVVIYTSSPKMADDLQELALKSGFSASIRVDDRVGLKHYNEKCRGWIGQTTPSYILSFRREKSVRPMINQMRKQVRSQIAFEQYDGNVYCVSIPPNELLYVRRNGKPVWCGNTHEIVRHRAGTAISQESLRYVRPREISLWSPPDLEPISKEFQEVVQEITKQYHKLESRFNWDRMNFEQKKRITSALRRILPDGLATNIIWSANHRTIRWVIEMRTDPSAEIEIRTVFSKVAEICMKDYPILYSDFTPKELPDGTFQYVPKFSKV
jgi:thymidylate synthase ThyX